MDSKAEILALLDLQDFEINFNNIEGNKTQAELFKAYQKIIELWGYELNLKESAEKILIEVSKIFKTLNYTEDILHPNTETLYKFWHLLYSLEGDKSITGNEKLINKLKNDYGFEKKAAVILAGVVFESDYGNLSAKAIKKILPHLKTGEKYDVACALAGYKHSANSLTKEEIENKIYKNRLDILPKNHLRNPVVEKILNQMINVVNTIIDTYGKPDEIRIELARELKKSAKEREEMTKEIDDTTKKNDEIKTKLQKEFGLTNVTQNDIIRYKLYEELKNNGYRTLYSDTYIPQEKLFSKEFDIEHIIPQSRLFDDSFSNKTLEVRSINIEKGNQTAFDYVKGKGYDNLNIFLNRIISVYGKKNEKDFDYYKTEFEKSLMKKEAREKWNKLIEAEKQIQVINKYYSGKLKKLIITGEDIPEDFINRDLSDTRYIAKYAKTMLESLVKNVVSTSGSITKRLREDWQLVDVLKELNWDKYKAVQLVEEFTNRDGKIVKQIKDWTKRNDHRHHALDALTVAFTKRQYVQYLNNLNARSDKNSVIYGIEQKELYRDDKGKLLFKPPIEIKEFRAEAKKHLENTLVSIKAKNNVTTKNINITKKKNSINKKVQLTPRGQLHLETVYGSQKKYTVKLEKIGTTFDEEKIKTVCKPVYKYALLKHLQENKNDPNKAFGSKNTPKKHPIYIDEAKTLTVPEKVKTKNFETVYTIRKEICPELFKDAKKKDIFEKALGEATNLSEREIDKSYDKAIEFIFDKGIRKLLIERYKKTKLEIEDYNKRVEKKEQKKVLETAFSNLIENPIINKNGKSIKRVTISGINNVQALHTKKDHNGKLILDENCKTHPVDFVNTGSNHHVAIFLDKEGNLQENVISFYEAVTRRNLGLPIIDKEFNKKEGWQFLFSMKQNEYFVFPNEKNGFSPEEIDLLNPDNYALISPNLFRVQKISTKNYMFRHHLETSVSENKLLRKVTWELIQTPNKLKGIIKVRLNHIGQIVYVGEY
jgi:CRISPR-associated endonuclease Csn1